MKNIKQNAPLAETIPPEELPAEVPATPESETTQAKMPAPHLITKVKPENLLPLALEQAKLFHTADRGIFADVMHGDVQKTLMLGTKDTADWIDELSYRAFGMSPGLQTLKTVKALFEGPERSIHHQAPGQ